MFDYLAMTSGELVSCIVPVFNGEAHLREALDSILVQDHRPLEVIVVDDGSSDGSAAVAGSYGEPVRVELLEHQGGAAARNVGIRAARGSFISFLDADDMFRPGKLTRQLERFTRRPEIDLSVCFAENFWEEGMEEEERTYRAHGKVRATHVWSSLMVRTTALERVGLVDEASDRGEEQVEWFARAMDAGLLIDVIDEVLVSRRMHPASVTHTLPNLDPWIDLVKRRLDQRRS